MDRVTLKQNSMTKLNLADNGICIGMVSKNVLAQMKVIKITGNTAFMERPAAMFNVLHCNVPMTGKAYSLGRSSDRFDASCCGNHFLDHGYISKQACPSSRKFHADSLFLTTVKGSRVISCG